MSNIAIRAAAAGLLAMATPAIAQDAPATGEQAATNEAATPADVAEGQDSSDAAERTAIATRIVDITMPVGSFAQIMQSMPNPADITLDAAVAEDDKDARRAAHEARTGRPVTGSPTNQPAAPMSDLTERIAALMEPAMRGAIIRVYARRYDVAQLRELESFFSTATGAAFARHSLSMMNEPEIVRALQEVTADMIGLLASEVGAEAMTAAAKAE